MRPSAATTCVAVTATPARSGGQCRDHQPGWHECPQRDLRHHQQDTHRVDPHQEVGAPVRVPGRRFRPPTSSGRVHDCQCRSGQGDDCDDDEDGESRRRSEVLRQNGDRGDL